MMRTSSIAWAIVAAMPVLALAGPLDQRHVAADAKWVVHLDADALRASPTARQFGGLWLSSKSAQDGLQRLRETIGLDPVKDLHALTFYGDQLKEHRGVAIVRSERDQPRLTAFLAKQPDYATDQYKSHQLHTWTRRRGDREQTLIGCFYGSDLLLFGEHAGDLQAALDVLDGERPALDRGDLPLGAEAPPGTILLIRAADLANAELPFKSPVIRLSELLGIAIGERGGKTFVDARLVTKSEQNAADMRDVAVGLVAMARLYRDSDEDALKILHAVEVATEGRTVVLKWSGLATDVLKVISKEMIRRHGRNS